jgi:bacteriocin-like protein
MNNSKKSFPSIKLEDIGEEFTTKQVITEEELKAIKGGNYCACNEKRTRRTWRR